MDEAESRSGDREAEDGYATSHGSPGGSDRRTRLWTRLAIAVGAALALTVLVAWSGLGMARAVPLLLERAVPEGWSVDIGGVEGSWLGRITLSDPSLRGPGTTVEAEGLSIRYRILPLLRKTVDVSLVALESPAATMSLGDLASDGGDDPDPGDTGTPGESDLLSLLAGEPTGGWSVRIRSLEIGDGSAVVRSDDGSTYALDGLRLMGRGDLGSDGLAVGIDTLRARFVSTYEGSRGGSGDGPVDASGSGDGSVDGRGDGSSHASADSTPFRSAGRLELAASLADGVLNVDTLVLSSDYSEVAGGGRMVFVARPELWRTARAEIHARPLDLRDLPVGLPGALRDRPEVDLLFRAEGSRDSMVVAVEADGLEGETTARADLVARSGDARDGGTTPAVQGSLAFAGLDLAVWAGPPFDGLARGELDFALENLSGDGAYSAGGFVHHEPLRIDPSRLATRPLRIGIDLTGGPPSHPDGPDGMRADAELTFFAERPTARLGRVTADIDGATVRWGVDLTLDAGAVEGTGSVDWRSDPATGTVESLRLADLDLSAIDGVYPSTDLTGRVQGSLQGSTLDDLRGAFDVALSRSSWAETVADTLTLQAEIREGVYRGSLWGSGEWGDLRTRYVVEVEESSIRYETEELAYARTDSTGATVVELHGQADGAWGLMDRRSGTVSASVDSARWQAIRVADARVDAEIDGDRLVADAELDALGALPVAEASRDSDGAVSDAAGDSTDAGTPTRTRIRSHADLTGLTLATATGTAWIRAERVRTGDASMTDTLRVDLAASDPGAFELSGSAAPAEGGGLTFHATVRMGADSLDFEGGATGALPQPVAPLGGATIDSLTLEASGSRIGGSWRAMSGRLTLSEGRWEEMVAEQALASLSYDSSGVRVDTLELRTNVLEASGRGRLPSSGVDGHIEIDGELLDLEPMRQMAGLDVLTAGEGRVRATATGSLDSLEWSGMLGVEAVVVDRTRMTGLRLEGEGVASAPYDFLLGLASTDVRLTLDRIVLPESEVRRVEVAAAGGPDSIRVEAEATVDDRRNASILVHVDPRPDRRTVRIEDLRFQVDDDEWGLTEQAVLQYRTGISLQPVLLRAGQQEIRLEGGVSESGVLDLNARMDSTDVTTAADLMGFPRLRGWLSGRVRVQGPTSAPEAWVDMAGALHRAGREPGPVEMRIRANGRRVQGEVELRAAGRGSLRVSGGALLPGARAGAIQEVSTAGNGAATVADSTILGFSSDSIDVALEADSFDVRWSEAFFTSEVLSSLTGRLHGSLTLQGSTDSPGLGGELRMRDGSARPSALGVSWDQVAFTVRGDGRQILLDSARIAGSSGSATVVGSVGVVGAMPLDLAVSLDDFQAIRNDAYRAVASGALDVGGMMTEPVLEGSVRIQSLDVYLDERVTSENLEPVALSDEDLRILRERFGIVPDSTQVERPLSERLTADLEVSFGRDSWLRKRTNPEMAVPFSGTIEVRMRPGEQPILQGSVDVIEGRGFVEQFGRRFALNVGTVTFQGTPDQTSVDLEATYRVPSRDNPDEAEVVIILEVEGTQDDLSLTFSSNPPLENADIVSYIATGRPASGSLSLQGGEPSEGGGVVSAGAGLALGRMTSAIENAAARSVGLDVVEIRREGLRDATVVAGKYVTPRLYVGFARPLSLREGETTSSVSESQTEVEIEYEALRWLLVNIEGSGSSLRFFLRGRRAY